MDLENCVEHERNADERCQYVTSWTLIQFEKWWLVENSRLEEKVLIVSDGFRELPRTSKNEVTKDVDM